MKWSFRLGKIAGIDLYVHFTFLILLAAFGYMNYRVREILMDGLMGVVLILSLFTIVVLHELGHALAARRYGIRTRDITLLPIGGVARLERMPDDPKQELVVALAGPAVNVLLAVVSAPLLGWELLREHGLQTMEGTVSGNLLAQLFWINLWMAGFNMIPAFPMDGGRVLRALLALRLEYVKATQIAAWIGQAFALLLGLLGLLGGGVILMFIALFVWMGAAEEASMVQMRSAIAGIPVARAMVTDFNTLAPNDTVGAAVQHVLGGFQQDFPVVEDGRLAGILTRGDLFRGLSVSDLNRPVRDLMRTEVATLDPGEMLEAGINRLHEVDIPSLPVVRNGQIVGILTLENVGELLAIRAALRQKKPAGGQL